MQQFFIAVGDQCFLRHHAVHYQNALAAPLVKLHRGAFKLYVQHQIVGDPHAHSKKYVRRVSERGQNHDAKGRLQGVGFIYIVHVHNRKINGVLLQNIRLILRSHAHTASADLPPLADRVIADSAPQIRNLYLSVEEVFQNRFIMGIQVQKRSLRRDQSDGKGISSQFIKGFCHIPFQVNVILHQAVQLLPHVPGIRLFKTPFSLLHVSLSFVP